MCGEWTDFDALQRASATFEPTDMKVVYRLCAPSIGISLTLRVRSKPGVVVVEVKAICDFHPRVVAIDLLTEQWLETGPSDA